jgi:hypothetical protein
MHHGSILHCCAGRATWSARIGASGPFRPSSITSPVRNWACGTHRRDAQSVPGDRLLRVRREFMYLAADGGASGWSRAWKPTVLPETIGNAARGPAP